MPPQPDIRLVRTDIAGFFGFAERGPVVNPKEDDPGVRSQAAVKLTSWNDFRLKFGGFLPHSYMAYAVRGFFATGGQTCYVVRVGVAASPPATAFMPLPAGITSTWLANLSQSVAAGEIKIPLDAAVKITNGSFVAVGDPAVNPQRLRVASIIDSQTITVDHRLKLGHAAGEPVFAVSGPAVTAPITFIASATRFDQTQIQLDSADVVDVGNLIAIGDALTGDCVSVMSVVDDKTITVWPPLQSVHKAGEPVFAVLGAALTAPANNGDSVVQVANSDAFTEDDLVSVEGGGISEIRTVKAVSPENSTISFGAALKPRSPYLAGSVVRKYDAAITVSACSPGEWGNRIKLEIVPLDPGDSATHFSLRVTVDQGSDPTQPQQQEFYPLLSLDPKDPSASQIYAPRVVNPVSQLIQISPDSIAQGTLLLVNAGPLRSGDLYLEGGSDGTASKTTAAPTPAVLNPCKSQTAPLPPTPLLPYPPPSNVTTQDFQDALDVLGLIDEIAILCCPEAAANTWPTQAIQQAMVEQCVRLQYRVAVLDTPESQVSGAPLQPAGALSWLSQQGYSEPAARFAAVYYPWLMVPDALGIDGPNRAVPPCGHVAGAYAYTDNQFGVQKPPANVVLQFVSDVQLDITNQQQGFLNLAGINAIRPFSGRGIRVWGARSISKDQNWIYIHTRRLMSMIEDSVEKASRWVVFQTNDDDLRRMLTHSLNVFLESIWLKGGLQGARPTEGYFVKCDSTNNPQATIDAGQLVCQVGVAVAAPMEFVVFDIRRSVAGAQVVEA